MEIIISVVILAMVMTGLANIFVGSKRWLLHARLRMAGGELGRHFLEPLQMQVRQDQWGSNCLSSNPTSGCDLNSWIDPYGNITYLPTYSINSLNSPNDRLRKVKLTLSWSEPPF